VKELLERGGLQVVTIRGWGWPVGRLYERLAYRVMDRGVARRAAHGSMARALECLFGLEAHWDSGDRGCGLIAVARRPTVAL
jgi:hypothetical protein